MNIEAVEIVAKSLGREVLGLRTSHLRYRWHADDRYAGQCFARAGVVSLHRDFEDDLRRDRTVALLVHELAHYATRNEPQDHGHRWHAVMRRCGVDPATGAIVSGGPTDAWLQRHRW